LLPEGLGDGVILPFPGHTSIQQLHLPQTSLIIPIVPSIYLCPGKLGTGRFWQRKENACVLETGEALQSLWEVKVSHPEVAALAFCHSPKHHSMVGAVFLMSPVLGSQGHLPGPEGGAQPKDTAVCLPLSTHSTTWAQHTLVRMLSALG
jgi:hypothetical protein